MATSDGIAGARSRESAWTSGLLAAATVVGTLVVASIAYVVTGNQSVDGVSIPPREVTGTELMQDLVNRGLIPEQALESTERSPAELMQDLVNRGLIPEQTLESTERSRAELIQNLVNRGLIPQQALPGQPDPDNEGP